MATPSQPPAGIAEYTTTTGTGAYQLRGAIPGYAAVAPNVIHRGQVKYRVTDGARQEVGLAWYDADNNQLVRYKIVLPSSDPVDWGTGRKLIYVELTEGTIPASRLVGKYPGITGIGAVVSGSVPAGLVTGITAGSGITVTYTSSGVTISATGGSGSGWMLPLVTGALPGPDPIADGSGQYIGVPI